MKKNVTPKSAISLRVDTWVKEEMQKVARQQRHSLNVLFQIIAEQFLKAQGRKHESNN